MNRCARMSLLAAAALSVCNVASAQDNLNNLSNLNSSNSIEDSKKSPANSSGNVLDSDELDSTSGQSNSKNSNVPINNSFNSNISSNGKNSTDNSLSNNLNSNLNSPNIPRNGNKLNSNGLGGLNNAVPNQGAASLNNKNANGKNLSKNLPSNGVNASASQNTPTNTQATQVPKPEAAAGPGEADAPPPPEAPPVDPNTSQQVGSDAETPPEQSTEEKPKKLTRAERRQARLELIKKMAESIPALRPGEAPLEYTVQPGDTLWDISDQLLDDAMWWPRLWILNPEVADPDKIEPGLRLVFYPSSADQAPELVVKDALDPFGAPKVDLATLQTFSMNIRRGNGPIGEFIDLQTLPPDQHLLTVGEPMFNATYLFRLPGFFSYSGIASVGEVVSNPNSPLLAGQGQNFIGRFDGRLPSPGERFLVLRETPTLSQLGAIQPDGNLYTYTGIVGVVRTSPSGYVTLVAEDSGATIAPNDVLIPANKNPYVSIDPNSAGRPNQAAAFVIATSDGEHQTAGSGMTVFLQSKDGKNPFSVGDDVELFMPHGSLVGFGTELMPRERVAIARIVDATPESAIGVILNSSREVTTGASTTPEVFDEL